MKCVKALVHCNRIDDVVHALKVERFRHRNPSDVRGAAVNPREQDYSVELDGPVISDVQLEVFCEDDSAQRAIEIFQAGRRPAVKVLAVLCRPGRSGVADRLNH